MCSLSAPRLLSVVLSLCFVSVAAPVWTVGQQVETTSGPVTGHGASIHTEVSEYLGIPFAAPPVGDLRWAAPQPFKKSDKVIAASQFGADCPGAGAVSKPTNATSPTAGPGGSIGQTFGQTGHTYSEDCLTLNVWTKPQVGEKKKAVLVWIYGGGFTSGSSNSANYNGQVFAEKQDVVVVSINYRLNVFGFPSAPGIPDLNLGLLDQRKATEWVRDNIEAFGGDAKRITIFGESAGSRSVDIYSYAWASQPDPIVNGFISESGSAPFTTGAVRNQSLWYELVTRLGCETLQAGSTTVTCARSKSMKEILEAATSAPALLSRFTPVVDEKTYFSDYDKRAKEGKFIQRPLLIGNNDNEAGLFTAMSGPDSSAPRVINAGYACSSAVAAQRRIDKGLPAFRYRWMGVFPNQRISPTAGAWHGSEISHVFGLPGRGATENQTKVAEVMNSAWAAFAKDPAQGLVKFGWPVYDKAKDTLVLLADQNGPGMTLVKGDKYDADCAKVKNNLPGQVDMG